MSPVRWIDLHQIIDDRGALVVVEGERSLPFPIRRVYYLHNLSPDHPRGFHAHRDLHQLYVCVAGSCRLVLDDGRSREEVRLEGPARGVLIGRMVWREMHDFSADCVLLVLASEHFSEADYIRDYGDFVGEVRSGRTSGF